MSPKFLISVMAGLFVSTSFANNLATKQYSDIKTFMHELAATYPANVKYVTVGASDSGDTIEGLAIGTGPVHNLVVATHHGNEYGSTEVGLAVAESFAKEPIAGQTVYVIPVLNIAGYNKRLREERNSNGKSYDPNRDYPGPCGTEGPHHLKSTAALAKFIETENIVNSATLHTYQPAVVYPWGFSTMDTKTAYENVFKTMVNNATTYSHYEVGNSSKVIYPADGTYEDYAFWNSGVYSILFELGGSHVPSDSNIKDMIKTNVPGIRKMLENASTTRATDHAFTGRCDTSLMSRDKHDE